MSADADRNLLFGILALQLDFISRDQLVEAMHAWVLAKQRPLGEIGVRLGVSENTARMRVDRALEKLQAHLVRRGISTSAAVLSTTISVGAVQTAPAGLAATATLPNGLVTTYTYDRAQRLTNLTNVVGSTTITSHA